MYQLVSLGPECKVDLKKFHGLGTSKANPATSCKQIHDVSLRDGKLENGVYWVKTSADRSVPTYCDLLNGGWTLVGKVSGFVDKLYEFWLIKNYNVDALDSPALPRYIHRELLPKSGVLSQNTTQKSISIAFCVSSIRHDSSLSKYRKQKQSPPWKY
jgi:hypothetical protein